MLGLRPQIGRLLTDAGRRASVSMASDDRCAAVISYRLWVRRFEESPDAIGRTLRVNDKTCAIVGIAPPHFETHQIGFTPDIWLPLRPLTDQKLLASRGMAFFSGVMGRLAPGVDDRAGRGGSDDASISRRRPPQPEAARQCASAADDACGFQDPAGVRRAGLRRDPPRDFSAPLLIILAVVGVVLLIASVNVANLLLARGAARLPELATRAALGAGRWRLVRQLATEGLMLAALGGLLGIALAWMTIPILASQISLNYIALTDARPDARVLGLCRRTDRDRRAGCRCPAGASSEPDDAPGRDGVERPDDDRVRPAVAAAARDRAAGDVAAARQRGRSAPAHDCPPRWHRSRLYAGARRHAQTSATKLHGRPSAALTTRRGRRSGPSDTASSTNGSTPCRAFEAASVSWLGLFSMQDLWLPLIDPDRADDRPNARVDYVSARYFETMGMQIRRGRGFRESDREGTPRVAVINQTLAEIRFRDTDPLGRRIALDYRGEEQRPFTVVGVVRDSRYNDLRDSRPNPMIWVPIAQAPFPISSISLRTVPGAEAAVARRAEESTAGDGSRHHGAEHDDARRAGRGKDVTRASAARALLRVRGPGDPAGGRWCSTARSRTR